MRNMKSRNFPMLKFLAKPLRILMYQAIANSQRVIAKSLRAIAWKNVRVGIEAMANATIKTKLTANVRVPNRFAQPLDI